MRRYRVRRATARTAIPLHIERDRFSDMRFSIFFTAQKSAVHPSLSSLPTVALASTSAFTTSSSPYLASDKNRWEKRKDLLLHPPRPLTHSPPYEPKQTTSEIKDSRSGDDASQARPMEATGQLYSSLPSSLPPLSQTKRNACPLFLPWQEKEVFVTLV